MPEIKLVIRNKVGLHARPAVLFVQAAQGFQADVRVLKDGRETLCATALQTLMRMAGKREQDQF